MPPICLYCICWQMEKYFPWDKSHNYDKVSHRCNGLFVMGLKRNASDLHCNCESSGAGKSGVCMTSCES